MNIFDQDSIISFNSTTLEAIARVHESYPSASIEIEIEARLYLLNNYHSFNLLKQRFASNVAPVETTEYHSIERYEGFRVRYTDYGDRTTRLIKVVGGRMDAVEMKIGVESSIEIEETAKVPRDFDVIRTKTRWSYNLGEIQERYSNYRLDLTRVNEQGNTDFQVEIEAIDYTDLTNLNEAISLVVGTAQETDIMYSAVEKDDVMNRINEYLGHPNYKGRITDRVLAKPRNIKMSDLAKGEIIPKRSTGGVFYNVTLKADGVRKILVFDRDGIYLASPPQQLNKIVSTVDAQRYIDWHGTVLEGELLEDGRFLFFDSLSISVKLSKMRERDFTDRQLIFETAAEVLNKWEGLNKYSFGTKKFVRFKTEDEFFLAMNEILDSDRDFVDDGLIFTPENYSYVTQNQVNRLPFNARKLRVQPEELKWKPKEKLTIDFKVVKLKGGIIKLMVSKGNKDIHFNHGAQRVRSNALLDSVKSGSIVEFAYIDDEFVAIRLRDDKEFANGTLAANSTWRDIQNPIEEGVLRGTRLGLINRYHNRLKRRLIDASGAEGRSMLTIGAGRGGDINKWKEAGFKTIYAVEPNEENREEMMRRLDEPEVPIPYLLIGDDGRPPKGRRRRESEEMTVHILPFKGQDVDLIRNYIKRVEGAEEVDVLSYMLSLTFLFKSEEDSDSIRNLLELVKRGGHFIALTLDGDEVLDFFDDKKNYTMDGEDKKAWFTQFTMKLVPDEDTYDGEHIYIDIPDSIVRDQVEYLTDLTWLRETLGRMEFKSIGNIVNEVNELLNEEEEVYAKFFKRFLYVKR